MKEYNPEVNHKLGTKHFLFELVKVPQRNLMGYHHQYAHSVMVDFLCSLMHVESLGFYTLCLYANQSPLS